MVAAWCFVCDGPVAGDRCPTCGRVPTVVEDDTAEGVERFSRLRSVPRGVWMALVLVVVAVLFGLLQAGFRFVS